MSICLINCRSVKNKTLAIYDFIISNDLDMLVITETWLGSKVDKVCLSELVPDGYKISHVPRLKREGGGVAILHKTSIKIKIDSSSKDGDFEQFEFMDCIISVRDFSTRLVVIYRPPPSKTNGLSTSKFLNNEFPDFLSKYAETDKTTVFLGDTNFHIDKLDNRDAQNFLSILNTFGLKQLVNEPTHVAGHILDVVITRENENVVSDIKITDPGFKTSNGKVTRDHFAILMKVNVSKPPPIRKTVTYRKSRDINIEDFKADIRSSELFGPKPDSMAEASEKYHTVLSSLLDKHAPEKTKTIVLRPQCPWFNQEIHDEKHIKRKLERKWQESKLTVDHEIYRSQCLVVNDVIERSRETYYKDKIKSCGNDQKQIFKVTNHLLGNKPEVKLPSHTSAKELAQDFSDFFENKIEKIRSDIASKNECNITNESNSTQIQKPKETFSEFEVITEEQVLKLISKSSTKSCELDPIPTWLLKECKLEVSPYLTHMFNLSFYTADVPPRNKTSIIRPLLKKDNLDQEIMKNFRPVANETYDSKLLESAADCQFDMFLNTNNLHEPNQSAYRKFHSTETALIKVQNDILQSLDKGEVTILVMLDLSAAFDTIDHNTLLNRLECDFGFTGKVLAWCRSYLSGRYQTVCIDGELSDPVHMTYSVPQGSVLGPKFYILFTKPVGEICRKHGLQCHFYADDSQIYISFKPLDNTKTELVLDSVSNCLKEITFWMNSNILKLNSDKTELIVFSSGSNTDSVKNITVNVDQAEIKQSSSVRNLGAFLDSRVNMEHHVSSVCRSSYAQISKIGRIRKYINEEATKTLVNSLVTSRLDYCNALLYGIPQQTMKKLQLVQNTSARVIKRTSRKDHITPVMKDLHWLPIEYRVNYKILLHTFKSLKQQSPSYMQEMIQVYSTSRNLRSSNAPVRLVQPKTKLKFGERSFSASAPKLWNSLPSHLKNCNTVESFKKHLKTHYFNLAYGK